jgi:hypothetical protein
MVYRYWDISFLINFLNETRCLYKAPMQMYPYVTKCDIWKRRSKTELFYFIHLKLQFNQAMAPFNMVAKLTHKM